MKMTQEGHILALVVMLLFAPIRAVGDNPSLQTEATPTSLVCSATTSQTASLVVPFLFGAIGQEEGTAHLTWRRCSETATSATTSTSATSAETAETVIYPTATLTGTDGWVTFLG
jgi:hypothetical protein